MIRRNNHRHFLFASSLLALVCAQFGVAPNPAIAQSPDENYAKALALFEDGEFRSAKQALTRILYPKSSLNTLTKTLDAHSLLAATHHVFGDDSAAKKEIQAIIDLDSDYHLASHFAPELIAMAEQYRQRRVKTQSKENDSRAQKAGAIGHRLAKEGKLKNALSYFEIAYELSEHAPGPILELADCERKLERYDSARLHYNEYLLRYPKGKDIATVRRKLSELMVRHARAKTMKGNKSTSQGDQDGWSKSTLWIVPSSKKAKVVKIIGIAMTDEKN